MSMVVLTTDSGGALTAGAVRQAAAGRSRRRPGALSLRHVQHPPIHRRCRPRRHEHRRLRHVGRRVPAVRTALGADTRRRGRGSRHRAHGAHGERDRGGHDARGGCRARRLSRASAWARRDRSTGKRAWCWSRPICEWHDVPLRDRMTELTGLPAAIDNDANCATYGEWWIGAARGGRNVIGVTIGTGIGGGMILDGQLYHGSSDVAGEIGHMTIDQTGRRCGCGNYGCLEAYASGTAIAERAREALSLRAGVDPAEHGGRRRVDASRPRRCMTAAAQGDAVATRGRARHRALPRHGHRQPAQHLQSGRRGASPAASRRRARRCSRRCAPKCAGARSSRRSMRAASCRGRCPERPASSARWRRSSRSTARRPTEAPHDIAAATSRRARAQARGRDRLVRLGCDPRPRQARAVPIEEWGGITYSLSGLDAALDRRLGDRAAASRSATISWTRRAPTAARCGTWRPTPR